MHTHTFHIHRLHLFRLLEFGLTDLNRPAITITTPEPIVRSRFPPLIARPVSSQIPIAVNPELAEDRLGQPGETVPGPLENAYQ